MADISFLGYWTEMEPDGAPGVASRRRAAAGISAVLGHLLTRPSTSELAQVISYDETYAPPPQPLPAPTEETGPVPCSSQESDRLAPSCTHGSATGDSTSEPIPVLERGPCTRRAARARRAR